MVDIEKKLLSDWNEVVDQEHHIDQKASAFEKKSADFITHTESLIEQKATQEVIDEFEKNEKSKLSLDTDLEQQDHDSQYHHILSKKINPHSSSTSSIASLINSTNLDSDPEANIWREKSYATIQAQISTLPFGLDKFFADA